MTGLQGPTCDMKVNWNIKKKMQLNVQFKSIVYYLPGENSQNNNYKVYLVVFDNMFWNYQTGFPL